MKRLLYISLILNVVLGLFYFTWNRIGVDSYNVTLWENWQSVVQEQLYTGNEIDDLIYSGILSRKPILKGQMQVFTFFADAAEKETYDSFTNILDKNTISSKEYEDYILFHNNLLDSIFYRYSFTHKLIQKEAKLTDKEVEARINNFKEYMIQEKYIFPDSLSWMSAREKRNYCLIKNSELMTVLNIGNDHFYSLIGGRGRFVRFFPVLLSEKDYVKKGEEFKAELYVGYYDTYSTEYDFEYFINDQEVKIPLEYGRYGINIQAKEKGELILNTRLQRKGVHPGSSIIDKGTFKIWVE